MIAAELPRTQSNADSFKHKLASYGSITRAALLPFLQSDTSHEYLSDLVADYPQRGGKMMRSSLCIAVARAFGASLEDALPSAVSIELLHNALLIHDDIQDGSEARRGKPTLHMMHGVPLALNAGDALCLLSMRPLRQNVRRLGPQTAYRIFEETERVSWESAEGQALELGWRREDRMDVTDEQYLLMVMKKTCWLACIHPCRVGALVAKQRVGVDDFIKFGFYLGAAFQITDDVLNLTSSDGDAYGKENAGDLWEAKRTLLLVHLYRTARGAERRRLQNMLRGERTERRADDVRWARDLMDSRGSIEFARSAARGLVGAALDQFEVVFGHLEASDDKRFIEAFAHWVHNRVS